MNLEAQWFAGRCLKDPRHIWNPVSTILMKKTPLLKKKYTLNGRAMKTVCNSNFFFLDLL